MSMHGFLISTLAIGAIASAATADRIDLRRSIRRAAPDAPIRLADIARLDGDHAARFADLVVLPVGDVDAVRVERLHISEIRRLLADAGADWGRIDLAGGEVTVRPPISAGPGMAASQSTSRRPTPDFEITRSADGRNAVEASADDRYRTLAETLVDDSEAASVAQQIMAHWSLEGADLEELLLEIDLAPLARLPEDVEACRLSIIGAELSDLVHVKVEGLDGQGRRPTVLIPVQIRRMADVPVAIAAIGAGRPVRGVGLDVAVERRPVRLSLLAQSRALVDVRFVADRKTQGAIAAGDLLTRDLLVAEKVVDRGDEVIVESRIGGYLITYKAIATTDGVVDGRVMCRAIDGDRDDIFSARAVAPGRVELFSRSH